MSTRGTEEASFPPPPRRRVPEGWLRWGERLAPLELFEAHPELVSRSRTACIDPWGGDEGGAGWRNAPEVFVRCQRLQRLSLVSLRTVVGCHGDRVGRRGLRERMRRDGGRQSTKFSEWDEFKPSSTSDRRRGVRVRCLPSGYKLFHGFCRLVALECPRRADGLKELYATIHPGATAGYAAADHCPRFAVLVVARLGKRGRALAASPHDPTQQLDVHLRARRAHPRTAPGLCRLATGRTERAGFRRPSRVRVKSAVAGLFTSSRPCRPCRACHRRRRSSPARRRRSPRS